MVVGRFLANSLSVLQKLQRSWDNTLGEIEGSDEIWRYWSEADLVHGVARRLEDALGRGYVLHVSSSLTDDEISFPELASNIGKAIKRYQKKLRKHRVTKIIPDIIVHKVNDISSLELCAELKFILGTNYWGSIIDGIKRELERLVIMRDEKVCDQIAMLVAFPADSPKRKQELRILLDKWESRLPLKRYNC